jgi:RNA polymerase sigma factor FliA
MAEPSQRSSTAPALWDAFSGGGDAGARVALIEHYMPFARAVAARLYARRVEPACSFEDYLQYARVGLIEAVDRFDATRGVSFEGYAVHRVRGAVLNGINQESEISAQREFRRMVAAERMQSLVAATGRPEQRASLQDFIDITIGIAVGLTLEAGHDELTDDSHDGNPYAAAELAQLARQVRDSVHELPEREREVIEGHYYNGMEFQEIARRTGVTKGRVSQLHAKGIAHLREKLAARPGINRRL